MRKQESSILEVASSALDKSHEVIPEVSANLETSNKKRCGLNP